MQILNVNTYHGAPLQVEESITSPSPLLWSIPVPTFFNAMALQQVEKETACWWIAANAANFYHAYLLPLTMQGVVPPELSPEGYWVL